MTAPDEIAQAATLMRARANAARASYTGRWIVRDTKRGYPQEVMEDGVPTLVAHTYTDPQHPPSHADHIAAADPVLMLALADWLESWAGLEVREDGPHPDDWAHALKVARLYLRDAWRADS